MGIIKRTLPDEAPVTRFSCEDSQVQGNVPILFNPQKCSAHCVEFGYIPLDFFNLIGLEVGGKAKGIKVRRLFWI